MFIPSASVDIPEVATDYTPLFHALSPDQNAGRTGYLILNDQGNDASQCFSASGTTIPAYQSFMSQAHADGWIVVVGTGWAYNFNQFIGCMTAYNLFKQDRDRLIQSDKTGTDRG